MCGICGTWSPSQSTVASGQHTLIRGMTDRLAHRGPDASDVWLDRQAGMALGHTRLSIIDLSDAGRQPMVSSCGRWVMSFNGEVYDFAELRRELEARGQRFTGHSDSEVLIAACATLGITAALRRVSGMLAVALWDRKLGRLHLARDRRGKKPLYVGRAGGDLVFASELKALHAHPAFKGDVDPDVLAQFLRWGWVPGPLAIFKGVRQVAPGTVETYASATAEPLVERYDDSAPLATGEPFRGSMEEAVDRLEVLLAGAVGRRMVADVPLGAFLSGGIDSSTITALMQLQSRRPVRTFAIGFEEERYDEAPFAKAVAAHLGTEHEERIVTAKDCLDLVPQLATLFDEPFADPSAIPTYLLAKMTREHVTVALSGDGGDELFAGYNTYRTALRRWQKLSRLPLWLRRGVVAPAARLLGRSTGEIEAASLLDLHRRRRARHELSLVPGAASLATPLTEAEGDRLSDMMQLDLDTWMADDILAKVDRASMAVGLEVRCPLLDDEVVAFAGTLPDGLRIDASGGKAVLRRLLARHVPPALVDRPKAGFNVPVETWLRGPLRDWGEGLLGQSDGMIDDGPLRRAWASHQAGKNETGILWPVLMFRLWRQTWQDQGADRPLTQAG